MNAWNSLYYSVATHLMRNWDNKHTIKETIFIACIVVSLYIFSFNNAELHIKVSFFNIDLTFTYRYISSMWMHLWFYYLLWSKQSLSQLLPMSTKRKNQNDDDDCPNLYLHNEIVSGISCKLLCMVAEMILPLPLFPHNRSSTFMWKNIRAKILC